MSSARIRAILETAVAAMSPALPTAYENAVYTPIAGVAYQNLNVLFAKPENPMWGGFHREIGYMQVTLKYPFGTGTKDANARAELIRAVFPASLSLTDGQITVIVSGTPAISPGREDGDRWAVPIKVPFFANVFE